MPDAVDHEARKTATKALDAIMSHESHCGERWSEARDQMKTMNNRMWWFVGLIITGQAAIIFVLVDLLK